MIHLNSSKDLLLPTYTILPLSKTAQMKRTKPKSTIDLVGLLPKAI
jgi:hypothetical protein